MKKITILIIIFTFLVLVSCVQSKNEVNMSMNKKVILNDTNNTITNKPINIIANNSIILTLNQTNSYEVKCKNECLTDYCEKEVFFDCSINNSNKCYSKIKKGVKLGKCGVECISSSDCDSDNECKNFKCNKVELGVKGFINLQNPPKYTVKECARLCQETAIYPENKDTKRSILLYGSCYDACNSIEALGGSSRLNKKIDELYLKADLINKIEDGIFSNEINECSNLDWTKDKCIDFLRNNGYDIFIKKIDELKKKNEDNLKIQQIMDFCLPILLETYTKKIQWISFEYQHFGELQPQQKQEAETTAKNDCQQRATSAVQYDNIEQVKMSISEFLEQTKKEENELREAGKIK